MVLPCGASPLAIKASLMTTIRNTVADINSANATPSSFESALTELEGIVIAMEAGKMPLQDALDAYGRGIALLRRCQDTLSAAEEQIRILDANGLADFETPKEVPSPEGSSVAGLGDPAADGEQEG